MSLSLLVAVGLILFVASLLHRVAGMGFALVASPLVISVVGVNQALTIVSTTAVLSSLVTLALTWKDARWRQALVLAVVTGIVAVPTILMALRLPQGIPEITAGILAVIVVLLMVFPASAVVQPLRNQYLAGCATGLMVGLAGMGGPTALAHSVLANWGNSTIPNLQIVFLVGGGANVLLRFPSATVELWELLTLGVVVGVGTLAGDYVPDSIFRTRRMILMYVIAVVGGVAAFLRGVTMLFT